MDWNIGHEHCAAERPGELDGFAMCWILQELPTGLCFHTQASIICSQQDSQREGDSEAKSHHITPVSPSQILTTACSSSWDQKGRVQVGFSFFWNVKACQCPRKAQRTGRVWVFRPPFGRRAHWLPESFLCTFSDPLTLFQLCSKLASLLFLNSSYRLLSQDLCPRVPCYVMYGSHLASLWIHVNVTLLEILWLPYANSKFSCCSHPATFCPLLLLHSLHSVCRVAVSLFDYHPARYTVVPQDLSSMTWDSSYPRLVCPLHLAVREQVQLSWGPERGAVSWKTQPFCSEIHSWDEKRDKQATDGIQRMSPMLIAGGTLQGVPRTHQGSWIAPSPITTSLP